MNASVDKYRTDAFLTLLPYVPPIPLHKISHARSNESSTHRLTVVIDASVTRLLNSFLTKTTVINPTKLSWSSMT